MAVHTPDPRPPGGAGGRAPALLLAVVDDPGQAARALAEGADLIDATGLSEQDLAVLRARFPADRLWPAAASGPPATPSARTRDEPRTPAAPPAAERGAASAPANGALAAESRASGAGITGSRAEDLVQAAVFDADAAVIEAGQPADGADVAAVVAAAAIGTWLGAAIIRTRHVRPVRRAIDMTSAIAGTSPPALTIRGLA